MQTVITDIIPRLLQHIVMDDLDIRKEAAWAICRIATGGTPEQIPRHDGHIVQRPLLQRRYTTT